MMKEGESVASVRGTVIGISLSESGRFGRRRDAATLTVQPDGKDSDEYCFEIDAKQAAKLHVGQMVGIEIKVIAADA